MDINFKQWAGGAVLIVVAIVLTVAFSSAIQETELPNEVRLPVLAIGGLIALLVVLALVAGAFTLFDLSNPKEALGLPEGSVRAVIALSLIVLFAILAIFLYTDSSKASIARSPALNETEKNRFVETMPGQVITTLQDGDNYTVIYRDLNPSSSDLAKQLLVMIGTLVTSVASFYFGAKSTVAPEETRSGAEPTLRGVSPSTGARGTPISLEISGDSLDLVKEIKVVLGSHQVIATGVVSNASVVKAQIAVPTTDPAGSWTLVATDGAGKTAQLANALTLT